MSPPTTEILVHIAAPSKVFDDVRYRALAQAYLDFVPSECINIFGDSRHGKVIGQQQACDGSLVIEKRSIETPSISFQSVLDNSGSPCLVPVGDAASGSHHGNWRLQYALSQYTHRGRHDQSTYVSPTKVIPDSQPENSTKPAGDAIPRLGAGRSFVYADGHSVLASEESCNSTALIDRPSCVVSKEAPSADLIAVQHREGEQTPSQTQPFVLRSPLSQRNSKPQPLIKLSGEDARTKHGVLPHSWRTIPSSITQDSRKYHSQGQSPSGKVPPSVPEESGNAVSEDCLNDTSRGSFLTTDTMLELLKEDDHPIIASQYTPQHKSADQRTDSGIQTFERSTSDLGPRHKKQRLGPVPPHQPIVNSPCGRIKNLYGDRSLASKAQMFEKTCMPCLYDTTTRILSPEPPVTCDHLEVESLITDKLAKLAKDLHLSHRYRPGPPSRAVQPFERGFWRLNTSRWPEELRRQAWAYLADYIGRGDAGWSVWCSRDPRPHTWIRLHCFAAVAGHTYLLLYLASRRQILSMETVWMDGSCTPTISVPPRK